jgi:O-antigen/teichoic acid export membrane protein
LNNGFIKNTLYSSIGFVILIICNFGFNFFVARTMGAETYGIFMSFFYLLIAFVIPINSLQLAVAKYTAERNYTVKEAINHISPSLWIIGAIAFAGFSLASPILKNIYNLPTVADPIIGGAVILMWSVLAGYRGIYQGILDFRAYGFSMGTEGILRAGFGVLFVLIGWNISGALGASVVSGFLAVFILIIPALKKFTIKKPLIDKEILKEYLKALAILLPFGILMNLDLTLIQNVIGGKVSGYVSSCGLFGKNLVTLAMVFANVVFSYALKKKGSTIWWGILFTAGVFGISALLFVFMGDQIVNLLFGAEYAMKIPFRGEAFSVIELLPLYTVATLPIGIMQQAVNYAIAKDIRLIKILLWVFLAILIPLYYYLLTILPVTSFLIASTIIIFAMSAILLLIIYIFSSKKQFTH